MGAIPETRKGPLGKAAPSNVIGEINTPKHSGEARLRQAPCIRVRRHTDGRTERFVVLVDFGAGDPSTLGIFCTADEALADAGRARIAWQARHLYLEPSGARWSSGSR